jgi:dTDP-4-dehydrorhamnose reductase
MAMFRAVRPDAVVHAAAIKDIQLCESDREACWAVNVEATALLVELARKAGAFFLYVSTDYVFDGRRGMYSEDDEPDPRLYYGVTKARGEEIVREAGGAVCRTSGLYAWSSGRRTFVEFVVEELRRERRVELFSDSYNSPTYVRNLCQMIERVLELRSGGTYHTAGAERISRVEFGRRIAAAFGLDPGLVAPAPRSPEHALRPRDVSLDVSRTRSMLEIPFLGVDDGLAQLKRDYHVSAEGNSP